MSYSPSLESIAATQGDLEKVFLLWRQMTKAEKTLPHDKSLALEDGAYARASAETAMKLLRKVKHDSGE